MSHSYALHGSSIAIRNAKTMVTKAISLDSSLLIIGENGTGKTEVANFIHKESKRGGSAFVIVPCSTIQETHLERELMQAQNGTLFFENIDKLSPRLQFVFFRALNNICVSTNPSTPDTTSKIRLMASATTDLENFVRRGFFREDLYLKFNGSSIYLPALRERRDDIPLLINYFIQKTNQTKSTKITAVSHDAMKVLLQHTWPSNLQEVESLLERVAILKNAGQIELCDLPPRLRALVTTNINTFYTQSPNSNSSQNLLLHTPPETDTVLQKTHSPTAEEIVEQTAIDQFVKKDIDLGNGIDFYRIVEAFENRLLEAALTRAQHNKNKAAQLLAMNRTTLVEKLRKRAIFSNAYPDENKAKYNSSFTIIDSLGVERKPFENQASYMTVTTD